MKFLRAAIVILFIIISVQNSRAQQRTFGLGIILGEPTGISAKLWVSPENALDFGLGWSTGGDWMGRNNAYYYGGNRTHFHMDYLWHSFNSITSAERFPLYYGIGGRINSGAGYTSSVAVRGVFGIEWLPRTTPIDVFLELVPAIQLAPSSAFGIDVGLGARYYF